MEVILGREAHLGECMVLPSGGMGNRDTKTLFDEQSDRELIALRSGLQSSLR